MPTRKFIIISILLAALLLALTGVAAAQEPPKGPEPLPTAPAPQPEIIPLNIDPSLLAKIDPDLLKQLLVGDADAAPFIAYMTAQANTTAAAEAAALSTQGEPEPLARRRAIVAELQRTAQSSQAGVLQQLNSPAPGGVSAAASNVTPLWIVNAVAASAPLETVLALAARPDVRQVRLDRTITLAIEPTEVSDQPFSLQPSALSLQPAAEWGIRKIRADLARDALGFDGSGIVVGSVDTGVDMLHPALQSRYRGYTGPVGPAIHAGNWFDATGGGATYPVDTNGHGTHTTGTAVGLNGIGVAPGAQWIAARAFEGNTGLNSWLHLAFQWMLAPNGDPALAPHVINNSWGNNNGFTTEFRPDIDLLLAAGIFPVFAAGNNGPGSGTVGSPGSNDNAFAVGATTSSDEIALFSSRGPSPWGEIKPEVSAPGADVRSSLPGGAYGNLSGTSMATPHVSGLAALLLQASPALTANLDGLADTLMQTAVPLGSPIPNNNFGWGRIDAYNALLAVTNQSSVSGTLTQTGSGSPISGGVVSFAPSLGGPTVSAATNSSGRYALGLQPGFYDATASAFGYISQTVKLVEVTTATAVVQNFSLAAAPSGTLAGAVTDLAGGLPLSATVRIEGTPVSTSTGPAGLYSLTLPVGVYTATVIAPAHRISRAVSINIASGATTTRNFALESAPTILLVDSGNWYQESRLAYFGQALEDARYTFDTWQLQGQTGDFSVLPTNVPSSTHLLPYDIVVWSSPLLSPGYEGADAALRGYLDGGGKLLLSGRNVAFFDGGGYLGSWPYFTQYLKARYVADVASADTATGAPGEPFAGLSFTITGGDGTNDQAGADVVAVGDADFASPLLQYDGGDSLAGLHVGLRCLPYRAILLAFGLEGVSNRAGRSQLMEQSLALLQQPPAAGIELTPAEALQVGSFGSVVSHPLRLRNIGALTDTISLTVTGLGPHNWPVSGLSSPVTVAPCASQSYTATVQLPASAGWHITDSFRVQAQSVTTPAHTATITRHTKTPAPVLLVDDDRWYSFADDYKAALAGGDIPFDYFQVPKSWSGPTPPSPPLATLQMYPITVWYTAYDWYQPLTPDEEQRLMAYLDGGGRLFFSSQDFLYRHLINHGDYDAFARDYLGVQTHIEDNASTLMRGDNDNPLAAYLGPVPFSFPAGYRNWTDSLSPTVTAAVASVGQVGQPNSLTHGGGSGGQWWRSHFLSFGPEVMTNPADHAQLMRRSVGWLSWLGASEVAVEAPTVASGDTVTFTAVISNNGWSALATASFTATFPAYLTPVGAEGGLTPAGNDFVWSGPLAVGEQRRFTYTAQINQALPLGSVISQTSWLGYSDHNLLFERVVGVEVAPNFSGSAMAVWPAQDVAQGEVLTYTLVLKNHGTTGSPPVTITNRLPAVLTGLEVLSPPSGAVISSGNRFTWTTSLARSEAATLTFRATISGSGVGSIRNTAHLNDGLHDTMLLTAEARFKTTPLYLPVISKNR